MKFANLHIHSIFSDGLTGTGQLAEQIYSIPDLTCFALTDHDTLSGIEPMFRAIRIIEANDAFPPKRFLPGVELSLIEPETSMTVHLLGYFPWLTELNHRKELVKIDRIIGPYCVQRTLRRGVRDLDERIRCAWEMNLDGLADRWESADHIIRTIRERVSKNSDRIFAAERKADDVIKHPIPITYQALIDFWDQLCPGCTPSHISGYILRRDRKRIEMLASLYENSGMEAESARILALERQGILNRCLKSPAGDMTILEGLSMLKKTGAVTVLAHPAAEHSRCGYDIVDRLVVEPMAGGGLDGIEVYYPYDENYRTEATEHYLNLAELLGLLVSGGTDHHGDGRSSLCDIRLDQRYAEKLCLRVPAEK